MAQEFIGFSGNSMVYNRQYEIVRDEPGFLRVNDVLVGAVRATIEGNLLEELAGGVFTSGGQLVSACLQPRSDGRHAVAIDQPSLVAPQPRERVQAAVFGGILFDHFGHFLLESTARLWAVSHYGDRPWIFLTDGRTSAQRYQREFLDILGLGRSQVMIVADLVEVEDLIIPAPAFIYHHWASTAYLRAFRARAVPDTAGTRPIFLSRSDTSIATTIGELELEEVLRREAWTILAPERLSASDQVALFRSDNLIMGLQGSAMHLGLFASPGRRVIHLCRGQGYRGYYLLDDLAEAEATYLFAMRSHARVSKPITGPFLLDLDATIAFLRDRELISRSPVAVAHLDTASVARMEEDYIAWWDFTESQIRFHRQLADDGSVVEQVTALVFARSAAARRPEISKLVCHALALTIKFEGMQAARELLALTGQDRVSPDEVADPALLYMISMIGDACGEFEKAIAAARRSVEFAPRNPTYVNQLAISLFRKDRLDEAEAALAPLLESDDAIADNFFVMSLISSQRAIGGAAAEWAFRAARLDRTNVPFAVHAIEFLVKADRACDALDVCRELLRHRPDDVSILRRAAGLELELDQRVPALRHLLRAYRLSPPDADLRAQCAALLIADGVLPDVARRNQPSPAECDQSIMMYKHSRSLLASGSADAAVKAAVRSLNLFPGNTEITQHLLGTMLAARLVLETHLLAGLLIEAGLGTGRIVYVLSLAEHELGDLAAARDAARKALELEPENVFIRDHHERLLSVA